jgi:hypothetical protein
VPWKGSSLALGVVQVRASQGRRGRDTGSYVDRGERREMRAWAARSVKRFPFQGTRALVVRRNIVVSPRRHAIRTSNMLWS